ncbi:MAG: helix-hairpin-helix domain-containing protein [Cytophagales bacterium]
MSTKESKGLLVLAILSFLIFLIYISLPRYQINVTDCESCFVALEEAKKSYDDSKNQRIQPNKKNVEFFKFNPNNLSKEDFLRLGLKEKIAENIIKYRSKGGKFKSVRDVEKIYGIDKAWVGKASEWMYFENNSKENPGLIKPEKSTTKENRTKIDLNTADSSSLVKIRGIGPVTANRIIKYREKLGGYVSLEQLHEVYGFSNLEIQNIEDIFEISSAFRPVQVIVNRTDYKTIYNHPYLGKDVTTFMKKEKRHVSSWEELESVIDTNKIKLRILKSYVTFD